MTRQMHLQLHALIFSLQHPKGKSVRLVKLFIINMFRVNAHVCKMLLLLSCFHKSSSSLDSLQLWLDVHLDSLQTHHGLSYKLLLNRVFLKNRF